MTQKKTAIKISNPHNAVFVSRFGVNNKPLFTSQTELAAEIMKDENYSVKNELTVRSMISQIFTGTRNLSKNIKTVLFRVLNDRFDHEMYDFADFTNALIQAFSDNMRKEKDNTINNKYKQLLDAIKTAKEILIVTLQPKEFFHYEAARPLINLLLEKIGLFPSVDNDVNPAQCVFYFSNKRGVYMARELWEGLIEYLAAVKPYCRYEKNEIMSIVQRLNNGEAPKLLTYLLPETEAMYPWLIVNYSDDDTMHGFCLSLVDDRVSIASMSLNVMFAWKEISYHQLQKERQVFTF